MYIVPDLFPFVTKNRVRNAYLDCFDQICQKSMELGPKMGRACNTSSSENACFNSVISAVFLDQNIGSDLGSTHQTMKTVINADIFIDSQKVLVIFMQFPPFTLLNQWQLAWVVTIDFISGGKNKDSLGIVLSSRFKNIMGAYSIDGKINGWMTSCPIMGRLTCGMDY